MNKFFLRLLINGVALYLAVVIVPGISVESSSPTTYLWLALIFDILNALLKPILKFLTCPLILLTLGLFTLLINTGLFYLTGWVASQFDVGFYVSGFGAAFLGAIVVSVVGMIFEVIFKDELKGRAKRKN
jgi:putative membrane protein